jgi:hypothetical protein
MHENLFSIPMVGHRHERQIDDGSDRSWNNRIHNDCICIVTSTSTAPRRIELNHRTEVVVDDVIDAAKRVERLGLRALGGDARAGKHPLSSLVTDNARRDERIAGPAHASRKAVDAERDVNWNWQRDRQRQQMPLHRRVAATTIVADKHR